MDEETLREILEPIRLEYESFEDGTDQQRDFLSNVIWIVTGVPN